MILPVTGGSANGKSEYAENKSAATGQNREEKPLIYLAAMKPFGKDAKKELSGTGN